MIGAGVDPALPPAWLRGGSLARGLPAPVPDRNGWRVETGSAEEARRWLFAAPCAGLVELGATIREPRHALKLCGDADMLRGLLTSEWRVTAGGWFIIGEAPVPDLALPGGYRIERERNGAVVRLRILAAAGTLAASGYAAGTDEAFVCDRIVTERGHRRQGLGTALMAALGRERRAGTPGLLVATEHGRKLYERLGWRVLSPYATAVLPEA